jgi:hypothetical protein
VGTDGRLRPAASAAGPRLRTRCVPDGPSFAALGRSSMQHDYAARLAAVGLLLDCHSKAAAPPCSFPLLCGGLFHVARRAVAALGGPGSRGRGRAAAVAVAVALDVAALDERVCRAPYINCNYQRVLCCRNGPSRSRKVHNSSDRIIAGHPISPYVRLEVGAPSGRCPE